MRAVYLSFTPAVIPVSMMPGRSSKTPMPWGASLAANSFVIIVAAALDRQYSARSTETISALTEVTNNMER